MRSLISVFYENRILYTFEHHLRKISKMSRTRQTMVVITVAWLISGTYFSFDKLNEINQLHLEVERQLNHGFLVAVEMCFAT